jgi:hypothetical protein
MDREKQELTLTQREGVTFSTTDAAAFKKEGMKMIITIRKETYTERKRDAV